jgi:hypothetical protein
MDLMDLMDSADPTDHPVTACTKRGAAGLDSSLPLLVDYPHHRFHLIQLFFFFFFIKCHH